MKSETSAPSAIQVASNWCNILAIHAAQARIDRIIPIDVTIEVERNCHHHRQHHNTYKHSHH